MSQHVRMHRERHPGPQIRPNSAWKAFDLPVGPCETGIIAFLSRRRRLQPNIRFDSWSWLSPHRAQASGADPRRACPATGDSCARMTVSGIEGPVANSHSHSGSTGRQAGHRWSRAFAHSFQVPGIDVTAAEPPAQRLTISLASRSFWSGRRCSGLRVSPRRTEQAVQLTKAPGAPFRPTATSPREASDGRTCCPLRPACDLSGARVRRKACHFMAQQGFGLVATAAAYLSAGHASAFDWDVATPDRTCACWRAWSRSTDTEKLVFAWYFRRKISHQMRFRSKIFY
jgi:hypothetical protein